MAKIQHRYVFPKLFLPVRIPPIMGDLATRFVEQLLSFVSHLQLWKACSKMAAVCNLYAMRLLNAGVQNARKLIEITHVTVYHRLCAIYASVWGSRSRHALIIVAQQISLK